MIHTPRGCIDLILAENRRGTLINPSVCTKIDFKGYEISIAMDSSLGLGDLSRADIRVYTAPGAVPGQDVTSEIIERSSLFRGQNMIYGTAESLYEVFKVIEQMSAQ